MNLAPVSVEHSHGDCAGCPGHVGDKFERAHAASRVGTQFSNDIRRTVKILDSELHFRDPRAQASWSMGRWLPFLLRCALPRTSTAASPDWRAPRDKNRGPPAVRGRYAPRYRRSLPAKPAIEDGSASRSLDSSAVGAAALRGNPRNLLTRRRTASRRGNEHGRRVAPRPIVIRRPAEASGSRYQR